MSFRWSVPISIKSFRSLPHTHTTWKYNFWRPIIRCDSSFKSFTCHQSILVLFVRCEYCCLLLKFSMVYYYYMLSHSFCLVIYEFPVVSETEAMIQLHVGILAQWSMMYSSVGTSPPLFFLGLHFFIHLLVNYLPAVN